MAFAFEELFLSDSDSGTEVIYPLPSGLPAGQALAVFNLVCPLEPLPAGWSQHFIHNYIYEPNGSNVSTAFGRSMRTFNNAGLDSHYRNSYTPWISALLFSRDGGFLEGSTFRSRIQGRNPSNGQGGQFLNHRSTVVIYRFSHRGPQLVFATTNFSTAWGTGLSPSTSVSFNQSLLQLSTVPALGVGAVINIDGQSSTFSSDWEEFNSLTDTGGPLNEFPVKAWPIYKIFTDLGNYNLAGTLSLSKRWDAGAAALAELFSPKYGPGIRV